MVKFCPVAGPNGVVTEYEYDEWGQPKQETENPPLPTSLPTTRRMSSRSTMIGPRGLRPVVERGNPARPTRSSTR